AERYAMEEALPVLPVWFYQDFHLYDPEVIFGVSTHPRQVQYLHRIGKRRPGQPAPRNAHQRERFKSNDQSALGDGQRDVSASRMSKALSALGPLPAHCPLPLACCPLAIAPGPFPGGLS